MNTNLIYARISQSANNECVVIQLWNRADQRKLDAANRERAERHPTMEPWQPYPDQIYLTLDAAKDAVKALRGTAKYYPYHDDLSRVMKFHPGGADVIELSGRTPTRKYYVFPGELLARYMQAALGYIEARSAFKSIEEFDLPIPREEIYRAQCEHAPRVRLKAEPEVLDAWKADTTNPWVNNPDYFRGTLRHLLRIAKNNSRNGNRVTVNLYLDAYSPNREDDTAPHSYYFDIRTHDNKRVMNGGIIAHRKEEDDGNTTFDYSTHT